MSRNTKEIALIQHRTGKLSEMPKALNQSEFGLASDANRLFIGNSSNTYVANRTEFPYQNLEILTECSALGDYFKYTYKNNIDATADVIDKISLEENIPIIIECTKSITNEIVNELASSFTRILINNVEVDLSNCSSVDDLLTTINEKSNLTQTFVNVINTKLVFISTANSLSIEMSNADVIGLPYTSGTSEILPERNVTEKLDDVLYITDFGVKKYDIDENQTPYLVDNSELIYKSLIEVYNRQNDNQYYRKVFFPAGTYAFKSQYPFPIVSNLYVYGEGIDRTIIKKTESEFTSALLDTIDINNGVKNVVIEDMTFDSSDKIVCKLSNLSNITFNRVKFKGRYNSTNGYNVLVDILGKKNEDPYDVGNYASNITFNDCEFEGGDIGILTEYLVKNVNIINCKFTNVFVNGIKIGDGIDNECLCKGINIIGSIFDNTPTKNPIDPREYYAIYLNSNSTYVIARQNQFDEELFENCLDDIAGTPKPYYIDNNSEYNFIETANVKTDGKKVLGVNFSQPCWKYLNYLVDDNGKSVLVINGLDSDVDSDAGLNIIGNQNGVDIRVVGNNIPDYLNNLTISVDNNSDIILGNPLEQDLPVSGNIKLKKTLNLNDNMMSNAGGNDDIIIETASNKLISVNETGVKNYETLIQERDNEEDPYETELADNIIPNVAYVKNASKYVFEKVVDYKDVSSGIIPLIKFDKKIYGNNVHLTRVFVSARIPFYKTFENRINAVEYKAPESPLSPDPYDPYDIPTNRYYAGDVVRYDNGGLSQTKYGIVLKTHDVTVDTPIEFDSNENIYVIDDFNSSYKSVKYIDVCSSEYSLTNSYKENYSQPQYFNTKNNIEMIDIQYSNKFGYNNCPDYIPTYVNPSASTPVTYDNSQNYTQVGEDIELTNPQVVNYAGINYVLTDDDIYTCAEDLHDIDKGYRKHDEGVSYSSELDKCYKFEPSSELFTDEEPSMNFSDKDIFISLYDEDKNLFSSETSINTIQYHDGALNPAGKLLVRIEFTKDEV